MLFTIRTDFFSHKTAEKGQTGSRGNKAFNKKDSTASETTWSHIEHNENVFFPHKHYKTPVICPELIKFIVVNLARLLAHILCIFELRR